MKPVVFWIAAKKKFCATHGNAHGLKGFGAIGYAHITEYGAVLLRQPRHIQV